MPARLRQVCLVAQDLDWSVQTLCAAFDTHVVHRDPHIVPAFGGMFNALMAFGDCFLEVVSPVDGGYELNSTSVKSLRKAGGDTGYMVILQVDDIAETSTRLSAQGARTVFSYALSCDGIPGSGCRNHSQSIYEVGDPLPKQPGTCAAAAVQLHPQDFGTLVDISEQWPPHPGAAGTWMFAGNLWQNSLHRRSCVCEQFAAVEVAVTGDPTAMARYWGDALQVPVVHTSNRTAVVELSDGVTIRFVPIGADGRTGVVAVDLFAAPGRPKAFSTPITLCGVRWTLVDRPGAASTAPLYEQWRPSKL